GPGALLALVAVHLAYYASYIAPLVGLALVLGDPPLVPLCLRALIYLCFVFAMPTPGGAGPSEAVAAWFFGDLLDPADAIAVVVVFRASTFYLQLAIGALYLPLRSMTR
ncbi:MAG TPA: lysylphosphatidylglycerol synthase domain-containing protein, partial [Kofleriaceae bacterium]|nr:lysylphosphatidylglycerol synthase domain-containing protein [Kofleriaceae bacterium]